MNQRRTVGRPPYEQPRPDGQPLASRDNLRIHGRVGEVSCVDDSGRTRWTHGPGRPSRHTVHTWTIALRTRA
ncbi:hypothetical protein [Streptomyces sp. NPDC002133]|uniref:hypothetical protein n=1 Tax=Streptomyces sp. NPDC002133 TaxID=3154409 RepID=UPI003319745F